MTTEITDIEKRTLQIALRKLGYVEPGGKLVGPRFGTGGGYSGIFLWDTAFTVLWAKYHTDKLPVENSLDNLYLLQDDDGFICREFTADGIPVWPKDHPISFAPPLLTWAELDLYEQLGNKERIARVYPNLKKHHQYCLECFGRKDGLFIGDPWGSGMDNLPRWPRDFDGRGACLTIRNDEVHPSVLRWFSDTVQGSLGASWNQQGRYVDMSAQMAFNANCLSQIAVLLDAPGDAQMFTRQHNAIGDAINERCWDADCQFYFDLGYDARIPRFHVGAYWTLIAGVVPQDRLDGFLSHLRNPDRFARPVPVPSLAADDPDYVGAGGYWRGSSWPPTTYMVLRGLRAVGDEDTALAIAEKYIDATRAVFDNTGTFWENLAPESPAPGNQAGPDFCGWAGLGPVAIVREFMNAENMS
jgi:glycogen debranching enzyme